MTQDTTPSHDDGDAGGPYRSGARHAPSPTDLTVPFEGQTRVRLRLSSGVTRLYVYVDPRATELVRVDPGHAPAPRLRASPDEVRLDWHAGPLDWLRAALAPGSAEVDIALHPEVEWEIAVRGGLDHVRADLSRGRVGCVDVIGGCSHLELEMPPTTQRVPVRMRGGASHLRLRRPADVGVSIEVHGGVSSLRLDDRHFGALGGPLHLRSESACAGLYELEVEGGASHIEIEKRRDG